MPALPAAAPFNTLYPACGESGACSRRATVVYSPHREMKRYSLTTKMKYRITNEEMRWRMLLMTKIWLMGYVIAAGMGWIAMRRDPVQFAVVFGGTGSLLLAASIATARRVRRCLIEQPVDVTTSAVCVPHMNEPVWVFYDLVKKVDLDLRKPQTPAITIQAKGTPRCRIRGYTNMDSLISELSGHIAPEKWNTRG